MTTGIPDNKGGFWKHPCPGIADIGGVLPGGRILAIEVKVPGNKTDPDRLAKQTKYLCRINASGGLGFFALSLFEVQYKINEIWDKLEPEKIERARKWFIETKVIMDAMNLSKKQTQTSRQTRNTQVSRRNSLPRF